MCWSIQMGGRRRYAPRRHRRVSSYAPGIKQDEASHRVERGIFKRTTRAGETRYEVSYARPRRAPALAHHLDAQRSAPAARRTRHSRLVRRARRTVEGDTRGVRGRVARPAALTPPPHHPLPVRLVPRPAHQPAPGYSQALAITVDDVAALIADMEQGWRYRERDGRLVRVDGKPFAAWTIRGVLVVLGRVLGRAARVGTINSNPVRRLEKDERPKTERRDFPNLDRDAIGTLIANTPKRYRALVAVSVLTGLRQGEALGLRWQDVDVKAGLIRVRHQLDRSSVLVEPKTVAAKREIPIPPSLGRMLADHKQQAFAKGFAKPTDFVFASETGGPLNHRNITRRGLEKAIADGKLPEAPLARPPPCRRLRSHRRRREHPLPVTCPRPLQPRDHSRDLRA